MSNERLQSGPGAAGGGPAAQGAAPSAQERFKQILSSLPPALAFEVLAGNVSPEAALARAGRGAAAEPEGAPPAAANPAAGDPPTNASPTGSNSAGPAEGTPPATTPSAAPTATSTAPPTLTPEKSVPPPVEESDAAIVEKYRTNLCRGAVLRDPHPPPAGPPPRGRWSPVRNRVSSPISERHRVSSAVGGGQRCATRVHSSRSW